MRDDDDLAVRDRLRDRLLDERADIVASLRLCGRGRSAVRDRPRFAPLRETLEQAPREEAYMSYFRRSGQEMSFVLRTTGDPDRVRSAAEISLTVA